MDVKIEDFCRLQPGVAHVVRIAYPRDCLALYAAALFDVGVDVGQNLAGVIFVGQPVDHRYARIRGKAFDDGLLEGAYHHQIRHA